MHLTATLSIHEVYPLRIFLYPSMHHHVRVQTEPTTLGGDADMHTNIQYIPRSAGQYQNLNTA